MKMRIDFEVLRQIPILDVARAAGLKVVREGSTCAMREEREVTSLKIFPSTNTWYRFSGKESGGVSGGSCIDLVMHINNCSFVQAVEFLTTNFPNYINDI